MLVILEAVSGPIAGRKIEVRSGTILRVGRTAKSDYALGEDSYLSGQHFAIENDGTLEQLRERTAEIYAQLLERLSASGRPKR